MNIFIDSEPNSKNPALTNYALYAEVGDADVNYAHIGCASIISNGTFNFLCNLTIHPDFRRMGYGTEFVKRLVNKYNANCLTVNVANKPAIHMYEELGFAGDDIVHEHKKLNGNYEIEESYVMSTIPMDDFDKRELFDFVMNVCEDAYGYVYYNEYNDDVADVHLCNEIEKEPI